LACSGREDETRPAVIEDSQRAEFAELGVTLPQVQVGPQEPEGRNIDAFEVWDINWSSFTAFLACENQWRVAAGFGFVMRLGLEWNAVDILLRRRGLGDREFEDMLVMERAALDIFQEERD
tara:strand:- start:5497 stop:5859 length:363 start_codon:yes stop_codon:yes gene_type:complete